MPYSDPLSRCDLLAVARDRPGALARVTGHFLLQMGTYTKGVLMVGCQHNPRCRRLTDAELARAYDLINTSIATVVHSN